MCFIVDRSEPSEPHIIACVVQSQQNIIYDKVLKDFFELGNKVCIICIFPRILFVWAFKDCTPFFQKNKCFRFLTFIKKTYQILVTNTLFSVINYSPQLLINKIFINTIIFFELYNLQLIYALKI